VQRNLGAGVYRGGVLSPKHERGVAWFQGRIAEAHAPATAMAAEAVIA
jgi:choline monooxygenase